MLEILLVLCQDMELRENAQYNLLIMELLHHLLKSQDPTSVARCMLANNEKTGAGKPENSAAVTAKNKENNTNSNHAKGKLGNKTSAFAKPSAASNVTNGSLRSLLARDKQQFQTAAPARHGNFGGTLMLKRPNGKKQYVSASAMLSGSSQNASAAPLGGPKKRKTRKTDPFIGSGRTLLAHTRAGQTQNAHGGPSAIRAQKSLHRFCQRFLEKCYGPVMKSLKNEFRRESARLEGDEDKVVLFHIIWFFFQWYRVSGYGKVIQAKKKKAEDVAATAGESKDKEVEKKDDGSGTSALGQLIFTMDVFTFNLVLNATSTFTTHKNYTRLAQSVALYTEMMHMLNSMYHSKDETEQIMALGLMDRLFYGSDPVDRLPKLLSSWVPGTTTREYICDLSELCYVTLKLLDANKKACSGVLDSEDGHQLGENKKGKGKKKKPQTNDSVMQMKMTAADFDVQSYFVRKIVSNHVVYMYTKLLEQYAVNSAHVNHRIIAFFLRLAKVKVAVGEDDQHVQQALTDGEVAPPKNLLALKTSTLEPMLYNIHLLVILNRILNDPFIQKDKLYSDLLSWAVGIIHNFATFASSENPMLFVECLLKHPTPHRFAELSTSMYVNDELRMIAERELLLEEQRRAESMNAEQSDEESEEAEEELEFGDVDMGEPAKEKSKKRSSDDSDDSSGDDDDDKRKGKRQKIKFSQKRHQFKKLKKASNTEAQSSDSSDEEAELESNSAAKHSAATSEIADKSEKPKGSALVDSDDEDDNADSSSKSKSESDLKGTSNLKSKSLSDDDSSDEEAEFTNGASSPTKSSTAAVSKSLLEDSSDEEGPQASSICKESSASATKSKPAFDDDSSDEEGATTSLLKPGPQKSITKMQKAVLESNGHRDGLDEESEKEGGKGTEEAEIQDSKDLMDIDKSGNGLGQEDNDGEED